MVPSKGILNPTRRTQDQGPLSLGLGSSSAGAKEGEGVPGEGEVGRRWGWGVRSGKGSQEPAMAPDKGSSDQAQGAIVIPCPNDLSLGCSGKPLPVWVWAVNLQTHGGRDRAPPKNGSFLPLS